MSQRLQGIARPIRHQCPRCGGAGSTLDMQRVRRRLIDRVVSTLMSRHRYRCRQSGCDWVGNLSVR